MEQNSELSDFPFGLIACQHHFDSQKKHDLRFGIVIWHCDLALRFGTAILDCDLALQFGTAILDCDLALQFGTAIWHWTELVSRALKGPGVRGVR